MLVDYFMALQMYSSLITEAANMCDNTQHLNVPWATTDLGSSRCDIKGVKLWNEYFAKVNELLYKKCFRKRLTKALKAKYQLVVSVYDKIYSLFAYSHDDVVVILLETKFLLLLLPIWQTYCDNLQR